VHASSSDLCRVAFVDCSVLPWVSLLSLAYMGCALLLRWGSSFLVQYSKVLWILPLCRHFSSGYYPDSFSVLISRCLSLVPWNLCLVGLSLYLLLSSCMRGFHYRPPWYSCCPMLWPQLPNPSLQFLSSSLSHLSMRHMSFI
jgi:hypothetical protein